MERSGISTKVCGLCRPEDARAAVASGADAVGVILAPAGRQVSLDEAEAILADVPPRVARVGVFVNADPAFVAQAAERLGLDYVQFHGDESPEDCADAPVPVIKVFRVGPDFDQSVIEPYRRVIAFALLDTLISGIAGGSGEPFEWESAGPLPEGLPVMVAGGLDPDNVADAIEALHPAGVDVSSGVEAEYRKKDPDKIRAFCDAVRACEQEEPR